MLKFPFFTLLLTVLFISGCSRTDPETISQLYWEAVIAGDDEAIQQLVVEGASPSLSSVIEPGPGSWVSFDETQDAEAETGQTDNTAGDEVIKVPTTIHWVEEGEKTSAFETETVLVLENDLWKVDPVRTRDEFFDAVYRSTLTGLEAALAESAESFREFGSDLSETMAQELTAASRELQKQSEQASREVQRFLESLDEELQKELDKHRQQSDP